jgi:sec-independent protein translocase protein TatB
MFGLGWTELLLIGVVALIVIGPKDLPVVMNRMGKAVSAIRRMGSEFQREINKASGLDQITDLRKSITEPFKQTASDIRNEFNKPLSGGGFEPSGAIKPKDSKKESVVDEIHEKVGITPSGPAPQPYTPFTKEAQEKYRKEQMAEAVTAGMKKRAETAVESPAPPEAIAQVKKPRAPRKAKVQAVAETPAPVDLLDGLPPVKTTKPRKPRAPKPKAEA